jgi:hypothetical protein
VNRERARADPGPQPVTDKLVTKEERCASAALVDRPLTLGQERAVRDADGRELKHRAELEREAGSARMVATGRVGQEHVRRLLQGANGGFQERAFAEGEEARLVWRARMTSHHSRLSSDARGRPRRVADVAGARVPADETDEDAADPHAPPESPGRRRERG